MILQDTGQHQDMCFMGYNTYEKDDFLAGKGVGEDLDEKSR